MSMTREQVGLAINTGLNLLETDIPIPAKMNDGVFFLKQLLREIASGRMALAPTEQPDAPPETPSPETPPPAPTRNQRRVAKKKKK